MKNPLTAKLRNFAPLSNDDVRWLGGLCSDVQLHRAKRDIIKAGDQPKVVFVLLDGWACRYKLLPNGNRQILAYLVPGDLCDVQIFILEQMDHSIGLLSDARVAQGEDAGGLRISAGAGAGAVVVHADRRGHTAEMDRQHRPARRL